MIKTWQPLSEEPYQLHFRKMVKRRYRLPDGKEVDFDILLDDPVVVILALTEDHQVLLARQYRPGPAKILLEMPAGIVENNDDLMATAERELAEETGYKGEMVYVGSAYRDAYSTIILHVFVATQCKRVQDIENDPHEFTEPALVSLDQFKQQLREGLLTDVAAGFMALDYLKLL